MTIARWRGLINSDGRQRSRRGATDDTTTNHQQEHWRRSDIGRGCSNSDGGGKGEGVVATALAAAATAATMTTVIGDRGWRRWRPSSSSMPPPSDQDDPRPRPRVPSPGPQRATAADDKRGEEAGGGWRRPRSSWLGAGAGDVDEGGGKGGFGSGSGRCGARVNGTKTLKLFHFYKPIGASPRRYYEDGISTNGII